MDFILSTMYTKDNGIRFESDYSSIDSLYLDFDFWNKINHNRKDNIYTGMSYLFFILTQTNKKKCINFSLDFSTYLVKDLGPCLDIHQGDIYREWASWFTNSSEKLTQLINVTTPSEKNIITYFKILQDNYTDEYWKVVFRLDGGNKNYWYNLKSITNIHWTLLIIKSYKYKTSLILNIETLEVSDMKE